MGGMRRKQKRMTLLAAVVVLIGISMVINFIAVRRSIRGRNSMPMDESQAILDTIAEEYSPELSDAIADLFYDSDYSIFIDDGTTFRSYKSVGDQKSWPVSNEDWFVRQVTDRGRTVTWDASSKGCAAYARFFAYSVYGNISSRNLSEEIYVDEKDPKTWQALETLLETQAQPGEHLRAHAASDHRLLEHSMVFLCTGKKGNQRGFYAADYSGGCIIDPKTNQYAFDPDADYYRIRFYTYKAFAKRYGGRSWYLFNTYETAASAG